MALFTCDNGDLCDSANGYRVIRAGYKRTHAEIKTTAQLKATLRAGQYAWPGGYPMYFLTSDGGALSFDTVRAELHNVLYSISRGITDGWLVVSCDVNWEDSNLCDDHTGERIKSAYGDDSDE